MKVSKPQGGGERLTSSISRPRVSRPERLSSRPSDEVAATWKAETRRSREKKAKRGQLRGIYEELESFVLTLEVLVGGRSLSDEMHQPTFKVEERLLRGSGKAGKPDLPLPSSRIGAD